MHPAGVRLAIALGSEQAAEDASDLAAFWRG